MKFRFRGVEKKLALGQYPEVSLKDARAKRDEARRLLASGVDPAAAKRQAAIEATISAATTFKLVADEFIGKMERKEKRRSPSRRPVGSGIWLTTTSATVQFPKSLRTSF